MSGKVDTGLQYNLYHNTVLNLRGRSIVLLWTPENVAKLHMANQRWITEKKHMYGQNKTQQFQEFEHDFL